MTFLVFCVFDLKSATREDYLYAYMDLATLGLAPNRQVGQRPELQAAGGGRHGHVRRPQRRGRAQHRQPKVQGIFKGRGLNGTFFLVASHDWACAGEST